MAKTFSLFGKTLDISDGLLMDAEVYLLVDRLRKEASQEVLKKYKSLGNLKNVEESFDDDLDKIYEKKAKICSQYLVSKGIYSYTADSIEERMPEKGCYKVYHNLCNQYYDIVSDKEIDQEYRAARKANRRRRHGIGFGMQGVMKEAAKDVAYNTTSGLAHSAFNAAGNAASSMNAGIKQASVYNEFKEYFPSNMSQDIYSLRGILESIMKENGINIDPPPIKDRNAAWSIYQNLTNVDVKQNRVQAEDMAFQILQLNPIDMQYLTYCFREFPDQRENIFQIGKYVGFDLTNEVITMLQSIVDKNIIETEEQALEIKKNLENEQNKYGITESKAMEQIDKKLYKFDIDARTFLDRLYDTREECATAKEQYNTLDEMCIAVDIENADEKACEKLNNEIMDISVNYDSEIVKIFTDKIKERINIIWKEEDSGDLNEIFIKTNIKDEMSIQKSIGEIQYRGRTAEKQKYIEALQGFTDKNIEILKNGFEMETRLNILKYASLAIMILSILLKNKIHGFAIIGFLIGLGLFLFTLEKKGEKEKVWKLLTLDNYIVHPYLEELQHQFSKKTEHNMKIINERILKGSNSIDKNSSQ